eukprot:5084769-Prymnesium_polylepis.4
MRRGKMRRGKMRRGKMRRGEMRRGSTVPSGRAVTDLWVEHLDRGVEERRRTFDAEHLSRDGGVEGEGWR